MKEAFGGFEFDLTETCFPSLGSRHKYKLTMILRQYYHYILATSLLFDHKYGAWPLGPFPRSATYIGRCHES